MDFQSGHRRHQIDGGRGILRGNVNQCHKDFKYGGKQCQAISAHVIAYSYMVPPSSWTDQTIDQLLKKGDELYGEIMHDPDVVLDETGYLNVDDIVGRELNPLNSTAVVSLDADYEASSNLQGLLNSCMKFSPTSVSLQEALDLFCKSSHQFSVLTTKGYTFSLVKDNDRLFFVDSHSTNADGRVVENGTAIVISYQMEQAPSHISELIHNNHDSMVTLQPNDFDSLGKLKMHGQTLQHSFSITILTVHQLVLEGEQPTETFDDGPVREKRARYEASMSGSNPNETSSSDLEPFEIKALSALRYFPHFLKESMVNNTSSMDSNAVKSLRKLRRPATWSSMLKMENGSIQRKEIFDARARKIVRNIGMSKFWSDVSIVLLELGFNSADISLALEPYVKKSTSHERNPEHRDTTIRETRESSKKVVGGAGYFETSFRNDHRDSMEVNLSNEVDDEEGISVISKETLMATFRLTEKDFAHKPPEVFKILLRKEEFSTIYTEGKFVRDYNIILNRKILDVTKTCSFTNRRGASIFAIKNPVFCRIDGHCHCSLKFTLHIYRQDLLKEVITIHGKTSNLENYKLIQDRETGRQVRGSDRAAMKAELKHRKAQDVFIRGKAQRHGLALIHRNNVQQSEASLKVIKSQGRKDKWKVKDSPLGDLQKLQTDLAAELTPDNELSGFLQAFSLNPFSIELYLFAQISLGCDLQKLEKMTIWIDLTGQRCVMPKYEVKDQRPLLKLTMMAKNQFVKNSWPLAEVISSQRDTLSFHNFFNKIIYAFRAVANVDFIPKLVCVDFCFALIHASIKAFNMESMETYMDRCWKLVVDPESPMEPRKCLVFVCTAHLANAFYKNLSRKVNNKTIPSLALSALARLQECVNLQEFYTISKSIIHIFGKKKMDPVNVTQIVKLLRTKDKNPDVRLYEESDIINDVFREKIETVVTETELDTMKLQREKSKFFWHFQKQITTELSSSDVRGSSANLYYEVGGSTNDTVHDESTYLNDYYCPTVLEHLLLHYIPYMCFWSCIVVRIQDPEFVRLTAASVESYFNNEKNTYHVRKNALANDYVRDHVDVVVGTMIDVNQNHLLTKALRPNTKKALKSILHLPDTDIGSRETWTPHQKPKAVSKRESKHFSKPSVVNENLKMSKTANHGVKKLNMSESQKCAYFEQASGIVESSEDSVNLPDLTDHNISFPLFQFDDNVVTLHDLKSISGYTKTDINFLKKCRGNLKILSGRVSKDKWLTDSVIDAYLHEYCDTSSKWLSPVQVTALLGRKDNLERLCNMFIKRGVRSRSWKGALWAFLPFNVKQAHWVLIGISLLNHEIFVLDSMGDWSPTRSQQLAIRTFLEYAVGDDDEPEDIHWPFEYPNCAQQKNCYDCGVMVLHYVKAILEGGNIEIPPPMEFRDEILRTIVGHCNVNHKLQVLMAQICNVCQQNEVDKERKTVRWMQCERCQCWAHVECTLISTDDYASERYICS